MVTRFDLEQQLMDCYHVVDDLNILFEAIMEDENFNRDSISNVVLGLKEVYNLRFNKCVSTFEKLVETNKIN